VNRVIKNNEYCGGLVRIVNRPHLPGGRSLITRGLRMTRQKRLLRNRLYVLDPSGVRSQISLSSDEWGA
jgi:hypothetical protein